MPSLACGLWRSCFDFTANAMDQLVNQIAKM